MKVRVLTLSGIVASLLSCPAIAQTTLIGWDVSGASESTTTLTAATFASNISTASPSGLLSRGSGAALPGSPSGNAFGASGFSATSLDNALTSGDYFSFTITPATGYSVSLSSVNMKLFDTTSGPTNAALFSSVGGFGSSSSAITTFTLTGSANNDQSITLSTPTFSNLTGTVEFRLYAYGGNTGSTDKLRFRNLSGDDLALTGSVSAIPEPSTYATIAGACALVGAMWWRRRQTPPPGAKTGGQTPAS